MRAKDVMTTKVETVTPDTTVSEVARILLERRISGLPVVDKSGKVLGIVSEGDLMRRRETGTTKRQSWWLELFSGSEDLARDYVKSHGLTAKDVMTAPALTVEENADLAEIAGILERRGIKRVPVMRGGTLVGILSRSNLLQGLAAAGVAKSALGSDSEMRNAILAEMKKQPWAPSMTVNVVVAGGKVNLYGLVDSEAERKAIKVAAETVAGTGKVIDNLTVMQGARYVA